MPATESNKARIAKRVIEVLEFFDEDHPNATVMDIVRRFDRPQSSTSELLSNMVGLGLLYKDRSTRSYSLTPRAALLGGAVQPRVVRDGRLIALIDRLSAQTGLAVGVFSMVGLKLQVCSWRSGKRKLCASSAAGLSGGQQEHLSDSAAGWLLLSTIAQPNRDGMIRRLNAEATPERRFLVPEMVARVQQCRDQGHATGIVGFGSACEVTAVLLPGLPTNQPLAIGLVSEPSDQIDSAHLLPSLQDAAAWSVDEEEPAFAGVQPLFNAA
jgi:DNA-binding IclR family transcriptional regulator